MGITVEIKCDHCSYKSGTLCLGQGMMTMFPGQMVGVCSACKEFTAVEVNLSVGLLERLCSVGESPTRQDPADSIGDCTSCKAVASVHLARRDASGMWRRTPTEGRGMVYECPKCGQFEAREIMTGLWD